MSQTPLHNESVNSEETLQNFASDMRSALDEFRQNWQRELHEPAQHNDDEDDNGGGGGSVDINVDEEALDVLSALPTNSEQLQNRAEYLFRKAVELEQRGKVYDALPYYRKAVQLDSNIELKYYERQHLNAPQQTETVNKKLQITVAATKETKSNDDALVDDLYEKFRHDLCDVAYAGKLLLSNRDASVICTELHISDLPNEILMYILRWVVSTQLDMRSLEQCAAVSKGMYLCARDEEIWRLACNRVWGHNVGNLATPGVEKLDDEDNQQYFSWRDMFMQRERVLFNGCYISKTTYLRMGENSFQDQYYRPVQLVEYYRYIRFLPDGKAYMMTNADEPAQGVGKLKNLQNLRPDILRGRYRLYGSTVTLVLQKPQAHQPLQQTYGRQRRGSFIHGIEEVNSTQYIIEFDILNSPKRRFAQLVWRNYSVVQKRNKVESSSEFDMISTKYPPLWFSPVRSFHLDAEVPLS